MEPRASKASLLERVRFEDLEGWPMAVGEPALETFRRSCREILAVGSGFSHAARFGGSRSSWLGTCRAALVATNARRFFETSFRPYHVRDHERPDGLFTGYFEPEVDGRRMASPSFAVPLYRRPPDLVRFSAERRAGSGLAYGRMVEGRQRPYFTRREIEEGALAGRGLEIAYVKDWADAFFIHVQGSGRVRLEDGSTMRLTYDARSGLPYTGIGGLLVERGVFPREEMSMQAIRNWMAAHPHEARQLMWENQSFIFFREALLEHPELGALGAQHVQLTPRRSFAVDRREWMLGTPIWLDTDAASGEGGTMIPFRQLLIAQDTGSAITGLARGDVYWGFGEHAARIAGPMKSPGRMTVLLPIPVADELGLAA
jgi:membrane-bound lytic murein transglycosylase A